MEDVNGILTNDDLENLRDRLTELEMEMHIGGIDHRMEIKRIKEQLKDHE